MAARTHPPDNKPKSKPDDKPKPAPDHKPPSQSGGGGGAAAHSQSGGSPAHNGKASGGKRGPGRGPGKGGGSHGGSGADSGSGAVGSAASGGGTVDIPETQAQQEVDVLRGQLTELTSFGVWTDANPPKFTGSYGKMLQNLLAGEQLRDAFANLNTAASSVRDSSARILKLVQNHKTPNFTTGKGH